MSRNDERDIQMAELRGILHTRRHLAATPLFKGIPDFRQTRIAMLRANTLAELNPILDKAERRVMEYEAGLVAKRETEEA